MTTLVELLANAHDPKEITGLLLKYNEVKRQRRQRQSAARSTQHVTKPYAK